MHVRASANRAACVPRTNQPSVPVPVWSLLTVVVNLQLPAAGPLMLLEGLQAGIAWQLAVLDDAELAGTGQSSADVLGVPGTVLAAWRAPQHPKIWVTVVPTRRAR
jgi:hypothetical protein